MSGGDALAELDAHLAGVEATAIAAPADVPAHILDRLGYGFLTVALTYLAKRRGRGLAVAAAKRAADAWEARP